MKYLAALTFALLVMVIASPASAVVPVEMSLSDSSALADQTTVSTDGSGQYGVSSAALDTTATTATIGSDGYLCGNVQYRATQRWYDPLGLVLWTYRSTFGVHVCHNSVRYVTALYDEPMDSNFGWGWCGNIVRQELNKLPYSSARSYTKGCFSVFDKIADVRYPWAKMTIGGNGGLWVRNTGVGS